jgi:hypothetical protein
MIIRWAICFLTISISCKVFSQTPEYNPHFSIQAGPSFHTLNESGTWHHSSIGYTIGAGHERVFSDRISLLIMLNYLYRPYDNYVNDTYDPQLNKIVTLTTSFVQHEMTLPFVLRYNRSIFHAGIGVSFSYLFSATLSESSSDDTRHYVGKYDFEDKHTTAPFSRVNIAPLIHLGINLTSFLELGYIISYELISDPQQYVFNQYNFLNQNLFLTLKFKKL